MDAVLRQTAFLGFWHELRFWWAPGMVLGLLLGAVGSRIGRPGLTGLLAGLTIPIGAAVEAALLPHYPAGSAAGAALDWARQAMWAAAGTAAVVVLIRAAVVSPRPAAAPPAAARIPAAGSRGRDPVRVPGRRR
ncbi:hypothetical protein LVY72_11255 [Arthrobacter sp. I2-34]|uniref:Uncharacterized protein n=2 Tax=Arthrobacter hankyongi TaxID=2904801 RepID=A0ABS9L792_9MICC|nr:hypothetical protein [Arthrobacter hankyongi]